MDNRVCLQRNVLIIDRSFYYIENICVPDKRILGAPTPGFTSGEPRPLSSATLPKPFVN